MFIIIVGRVFKLVLHLKGGVTPFANYVIAFYTQLNLYVHTVLHVLSTFICVEILLTIALHLIDGVHPVRLLWKGAINIFRWLVRVWNLFLAKCKSQYLLYILRVALCTPKKYRLLPIDDEIWAWCGRTSCLVENPVSVLRLTSWPHQYCDEDVLSMRCGTLRFTGRQQELFS